MNLPENIKQILVLGAILTVSTIFFLGLSGGVATACIFLIFLIPTYLILSKFQLDEDEKLIFSFFIGVGLVPSFVFWMALYISLKLSTIIAVALILIAGFFLPKRSKKENK